MITRRDILAAMPALAATLPALAQGRTVRIIVPFTAGSPNDVLARLLAQHLANRTLCTGNGAQHSVVVRRAAIGICWARPCAP